MTLQKYRVEGSAVAGDEANDGDNDNDNNDDDQLVAYDPDDSAFRRSTRSLRAAYERHREALAVGNLEREQPFSWQYGLMSLFAYILMLSDVFRTGVAIHHLPYHTLEPNSYAYFGPLAYVSHHLTAANATAAETTAFWSYKYDTTSQTMRTFAAFFELPEWSPCVMYKASCDETKGIPLASVFQMVDSLVDRVSTHKGAHHLGDRAVGAITLRSHNAYKDRVHHYALPWFFNPIKRRTNQAIYHSHAHWHRFTSVCAEAMGARRPYSCAQPWTNGRRLNCKTSVTDAVCQTATPRIWDGIPTRQHELTRAYPNHTVDFVILDGTEDYPRGSLTFQGRKDVDVVVLSRIRQCDDDAANCVTVAVDDYRYEAAVFMMNALDWYTCVGLLRVVGQTFAWVRLVALVVGCCVARMREPRFRDATLVARVIVSVRTVFLIPSQVIVYGSSFPISCYLLAHLIDSPAAYAMVQAYFTSLLGQMHWSLTDFFQHCAVSMRTVWVVGFICHRLVYLTTSSNWSPIHGVPGMGEFAITFIAMLTIFAQFRSLTFRDTRILKIFEVVPSERRHHILSESLDSSRGAINNLLSGSPIDMQCLLCGFLGLTGISMVVWLIRHTNRKLMPLRLTLTSSTIAPYSAGILWPRSRLVVSWYGSVLSLDGDPTKPKSVIPQPPVVRPTNSENRQSALDSIKKARQLYHELMDLPDKALVMRENTVSKLLQRDMHSVDRRSREIESTVYLVNLAVMTDPFTFLELRVFDGRLVGLYQAKETKRCFLLPFGLVMSDVDIPIDWDELELIAVVNSKDLEWPDLLRCG